MNSVVDYVLVGLVLLVSTGYAVTSLGPRSLRRNLSAALGRLLARLPAVLGLGGVSRRLTIAATDKAQGACGGCDNCGSAAAGQSSPIQGVSAQSLPTPSTPPAEVRVPVAKIGWRA